MSCKIERTFQAEAVCEFSLDIEGLSYLVIYGKHINGYYICVPNWGWGCEASGPDSVGYNEEKLRETRCPEKIALEIAKAICLFHKQNPKELP